MRSIVFSGPSLSVAEIEAQLPGATALPPAERGDIYQVALERPDAIGLIDGYFEQKLSVWHKEILWAMEAGIAVYGASSMGALRAAELAAFGMRGVGAIFEKFHSGEWLDDDEVAVSHASAEFDYRSGSEALANIRFTLEQARLAGVVTAAEQECYIAMAKSWFYPDRTYTALLEAMPHPVLAAWLPANRVDQKRADAQLMLREMASAEPHRPEFVLEQTVFWDQLRQELQRVPISEADRKVLATVNDAPELRTAAVSWWLARYEFAGPASIFEANQKFCDRHGLSSPEAVERWLTENHYRPEDLNALLTAAARAARAEQFAGCALEEVLLQYLRWTGEYQCRLRNA